MWDYNKLFAIGNIIGVNVKTKNIFNISTVDNDDIYEWKLYYANEELKYKDNEHREYESYIQYIIRLDEHGNVVEKLFDREKDMPKFMPELKTGMFIRTCYESYTNFQLGYIDAENNRVVFQSGSFNDIDGEFGINSWKCSKVVEVYDISTCSFDLCAVVKPIWRDPEYQKYLDSQIK